MGSWPLIFGWHSPPSTCLYTAKQKIEVSIFHVASFAAEVSPQKRNRTSPVFAFHATGSLSTVPTVTTIVVSTPTPTPPCCHPPSWSQSRLLLLQQKLFSSNVVTVEGSDNWEQVLDPVAGENNLHMNGCPDSACMTRLPKQTCSVQLLFDIKFPH